MIILLTNDDGIDSPGLAALAAAVHAAEPAADVWIVAPSQQQSGCSHAITLHSPLRVERRTARVLSVTGTSADCVFLAVHHLLPQPPTITLSGINAGPNLGDDLHYSGTAGAAAEAALLGLPALAVSVAIKFADKERGEPAWDSAANCACQMMSLLLQEPLPGAYLNLNVPDLPAAEVQGIRACHLGRRRYLPEVLRREDGLGRPYYWLSARHDGFHDVPDSDGPLIEQGFATVTPVGVSLTAESHLGTVDRFADYLANRWPPPSPEDGPFADLTPSRPASL
jgi:5'-nucleotidase